MAAKPARDVSVALTNLEKSLGNSNGDPKINLYGYNTAALEVIPFDTPAVTVTDEAGGGKVSMTLDEASSIGGVPRGKVVELFGPESSGKSWMGLKLAASAQRLGLRAAVQDVEVSFVGGWAQQHGVDLSKLLYGNDFDCGEEALMYTLEMCKQRTADYIMLDSVAALIPKAELEHKLDERTMGEAARMMSTAVKQIMQACASGGTTVVFINQIRDKIGVMFGNPETTPGGKALKFYASMRIRTWRKKVEMEKGRPIRAISVAKFVKNRVGLPFQAAAYAIDFNARSTDPVMILVRKAVELRAVTKKKGQNEFIYGSPKDGEPTGCTDIGEVAEWLRFNDRVEVLRESVVALANTKQEKLDPVLMAPLPATAVPASPEVTGPDLSDSE